MRYLFVALVFWCVASASAKPAPPPREKPKPLPVINLEICGPTNWGEFTQTGRYFTLIGDPSWSASGHIRADGKLFVLWILNSDGHEAPSLYTLMPDGSLVGDWGWKEDCEILGNGKIVGDVRPDTIRKVKASPKVEEPGTPIN